MQGSANEKESMEKLLKEQQIEIVISAVGGEKILDQLNLIEAIKAAGTVKVYVRRVERRHYSFMIFHFKKVFILGK